MLNAPSKNWIAQWLRALSGLFVNVTVVPTGTPMFCGNIAFDDVDSALVADVRASSTVFATVAPSTSAAAIGWRFEGAGGVGAGARFLPNVFSLNAHRWSPRGELY